MSGGDDKLGWDKGSKMSSSLRERLKKSGRCRSSPLARPAVSSLTAARQAVTVPTPESDTKDAICAQNNQPTGTSGLVKEKVTKPTETKSILGDAAENLTSAQIQLRMKDSIQRKEERLRKLKMVKLYRSKNDLACLRGLISKWKEVSQSAVRELYELTSSSEPKPTMNELLKHLGLYNDKLRYDEDQGVFEFP